MLSVGFHIPLKTVLLSTGPLENKIKFIETASLLQKMSTTLYATTGTHKFLQEHGIDSKLAPWPDEKEERNVLNILENNAFDLVINIPKNFQKNELTYGYLIRRKAVDHAIPLITNFQLAKRFIEAIYWKPVHELKIKALDEY